MTNRSGGATVGAVYCQHLVDGAINDHHRGASVSIDAATLECTSVQKTGRTAAAAAAVSEYRAGHSSCGKNRACFLRVMMSYVLPAFFGSQCIIAFSAS